MRFFNILAAVAATMAIGSMASAKDKPEQAKEKKICKYQEPDSTSRLGKRICRTKAQWANGSDRGDRDAGRTISGSGRTN